MLVLENISIVMMLVSEGGENSQMTLIKYFVNFHKRIIVYRSVWLSSQDTQPLDIQSMLPFPLIQHEVVPENFISTSLLY